jgi:hypothetical protein
MLFDLKGINRTLEGVADVKFSLPVLLLFTVNSYPANEENRVS